MTKIKAYPIDETISGSDKWIGSDSNSFNRTKNFTVASLSDYYNETASINLANAISFRYDTVDQGDVRKSGSFSFKNEVGSTVPFSQISQLLFSKTSSKGKNVVDLMNFYNGNIIYINKSDNPNIFAVYNVLSYTEDIDNPGFYETTFNFIDGNGSIEEDELYFVSLLQLKNSVDGYYVHNQDVASSSWNVQHNLGKFPSCTLTLSTGQLGYGDVTFIDQNNLTITLASPESGKAYIN